MDSRSFTSRASKFIARNRLEVYDRGDMEMSYYRVIFFVIFLSYLSSVLEDVMFPGEKVFQ